MLSTGISNKQKLFRTFRLNFVRSSGLLPDGCALIQLSRMGPVIFLAGLMTFSLLSFPGGALAWSTRFLGSAGLVALLLPTIYLMWGRPLTAYVNTLRQREEEVRSLSHRLVSASEQERRRLALDLHDEFGQSLSALRWGMERIKILLGDRLGAEAASCEQLLAQVDALGARIRHLSATLHPVMLEDLGLVPTLQWAVDELTKRQPELKVELQTQGLKRRLPQDIELVLYRVAQEAMTNAVRHARPETLTLTLTACHPKVLLQIRDDGVGFEPPETPAGRWSGGLGLYGMRERVANLGGRLSLNSAPGAGTLVRVEVPVSQEASDGSHPYSDCR